MNWRSLHLLLAALVPHLAAADALPGTPLLAPAATPEQRSEAMVGGIGRWLHRESDRQAGDRHQRWAVAAAGGAWETFAKGKRAELQAILGFEPKRAAPTLERMEHGRVRWPVFEDVSAEGMLFEPEGPPVATVIAVPDADELPEHCALARRLVPLGCRVLVPVLVNRRDDFSGNEAIRFTHQPHREWIYRQAFEMGRTLIGYEVQKIIAAVDALHTEVGIAGEGEGGLLALRAAALDPRLRAVLLSGSFQPHTAYETEPIDRNLFASQHNFGDAELAGLVAPRPLIVEHFRPALTGPNPAHEGLPGTTPGVLLAPSREAVAAELALANCYRPASSAVLTYDGVESFVQALVPSAKPSPHPLADALRLPEYALERQRRTVRDLEAHTQRLVFGAERKRNEQVSMKLGTPEWPAARAALQERLWASIGQLPGQRLPPNPRARQVLDAPKWTAYEVMLDVVPDVFAWGWLLVPKDLQPGERRPVVVCQHGLEGLPGDTVTEDPKDPAYHYYHGFAARLAEEGYITYAPHNPYRGHDAFRVLQRQANPLGLSLFSFIIAQHEVTTAWLASLPFVDPARIGFYGLSYGGKSAMRIPALVPRYALSICSGDFNEWIRKNVSVEERNSYMFSGEYEMPEWNLAWNANYAEMAMLIAPRPFMVERGHGDGVATDEWVGYEYAKVQRGYLRLGVSALTTIEWFDGPHTIHGVGTFAFLRQQLGPAKR